MSFIPKLFLVICFTIFNILISHCQTGEVNLILENNYVFEEKIDLKQEGIILVTRLVKNNLKSYYKLIAYDNKLNHKWTIDIEAQFLLNFVISSKGYPIYTANTSAKEITILKINKRGDITKFPINIKKSGEYLDRYSSTSNGGFSLLTQKKNNNKINDYTIRNYNSSFLLQEESTFSIQKIPIKNAFWNNFYFNGNSTFFCLTFLKPEKDTKVKKIKVHYISVNNEGKKNITPFISSHTTIKKFEAQKTINYHFDSETLLNYIIYPNEEGNNFHIDCFDAEGNLKWTKKHEFTKESLLNYSYRYNNTFKIESINNKILGVQIIIDDKIQAHNFFLSKENGSVISKNNTVYDKHRHIETLISNYFSKNARNSEIISTIKKKTKELDSEKNIEYSIYSYISKKESHIFILHSQFSKNKIKIISFDK